MRYFRLAFALLLFSAALVAQVPPPTPKDSNLWHITPGGSAGVITAHMTEVDLIKIFGKKNVTWGDADVGEGDSLPGTILFASDPHRRLEIIWTDNERRTLPKQAQIFGKSRSQWETTAGISVGTSLKELERINGKPFVLGGFDIDYEGMVRSWKSGRLKKEFFTSGVIIRLRPSKRPPVSDDELNSVGGVGPFLSSNSIMQRVNPTIYQIIWVFR
jgi:hypothetical protein